MRKITVIFFMFCILFSCPTLSKSENNISPTKEEDVQTLLNLGAKYLYEDKAHKDINKAIYYYEKAAKKESIIAQSILGLIYYWGNEIGGPDYIKARKYLEKPAIEHNVDGIPAYCLGIMYLDALGGEADPYKAMRLFELSAKEGNHDAQVELGIIYYEGKLVDKNFSKAIDYFKNSAKYNNKNAQLFLGMIYQNGDGVKQDFFEARNWYEKSAAQQNGAAQFFLGQLYEKGLGVRQDFIVAKEWYGKACDNRYQSGCNKYRELNEMMMRR